MSEILAAGFLLHILKDSDYPHFLAFFLEMHAFQWHFVLLSPASWLPVDQYSFSLPWGLC